MIRYRSQGPTNEQESGARRRGETHLGERTYDGETAREEGPFDEDAVEERSAAADVRQPHPEITEPLRTPLPDDLYDL